MGRIGAEEEYQRWVCRGELASSHLPVLPGGGHSHSHSRARGRASVRVTTWNLEWFPNGSPKDALPEEQARRINGAAEVLRRLNPDVLLLQEVRDYDSCSRLAEAIAPKTYQVAICSAFKEPFQSGFGRQQVAILAKYPAQAAWAERWKSMEGIDPPRGFVFAWFKIGGSDLGVYSVHLKSNLIIRGNKKEAAAKNIRKREVAAHQLVEHLKSVVATAIPNIRGTIIGGDFNTNQDQSMFLSEKTFAILEAAGFQNSTAQLPLLQRVTHPSSGRYPNATFDYLWVKNGNAGAPRILNSPISDHYPLTCDIEIPAAAITPQFATITRPVTLQVPYGQIVLPPGTKLPIVSRTLDTVNVRYMDKIYPVAISATDLNGVNDL